MRRVEEGRTEHSQSPLVASKKQQYLKADIAMEFLLLIKRDAGD